MTSPHIFPPSEASSSSFTINMRAIVLLCLLLVAFGVNSVHSWTSWVQGAQSSPTDVCLADNLACGCCLMQRQINRMKEKFNLITETMIEHLNKSKTELNHFRASRSAFSVALNNDSNLNCFGPFSADTVITYKHVFLNLGNGYDTATGFFTVPRSGVYSLSTTIYSNNATGQHRNACANLQVNGHEATQLEKYQMDAEDSNTVVMAVKLMAGDKVAVTLQKDCFVCDNLNHYSTFTGFLLFVTDQSS